MRLPLLMGLLATSWLNDGISRGGDTVARARRRTATSLIAPPPMPLPNPIRVCSILLTSVLFNKDPELDPTPGPILRLLDAWDTPTWNGFGCTVMDLRRSDLSIRTDTVLLLREGGDGTGIRLGPCVEAEGSLSADSTRSLEGQDSPSFLPPTVF